MKWYLQFITSFFGEKLLADEIIIRPFIQQFLRLKSQTGECPSFSIPGNCIIKY